MRSSTLAVLALVTVGLVGGAFILATGRESAAPTAALPNAVFPDLAQRAGEAATITLTTGARSFTLARTEGQRWVVRELENYPVPFARVSKLAGQMAALRPLETKTDDPARYAELDVDAPGAKSRARQVTIQDAGGAVLADLVIGKRELGMAATGQAGTYVRKVGEAAALLVEGTVEVPADPLVMLGDRTLLDVKPETIHQIAVREGGREILGAERSSPDGAWTVSATPTPTRAFDPAKIDRLTGIPVSLLFDDVTAESKVTFQADDRQVAVRTFDGLEIVFETARQGSDSFIRVASASAIAPVVPDTPSAATAAAPASASSAQPDPAQPDPAQLDPAARAAQFAQRTKGWAYRLAGYKAGQFMVKPEELLVDPSPAETGNQQGQGAAQPKAGAPKAGAAKKASQPKR